jgi:uncharacterized protein YutE (UPF0331/DUF86 family)
MGTLSEWVRFRNIIAHECLDIRWASIKRVIEEAEPSYNNITDIQAMQFNFEGSALMFPQSTHPYGPE